MYLIFSTNVRRDSRFLHHDATICGVMMGKNPPIEKITLISVWNTTPEKGTNYDICLCFLILSWMTSFYCLLTSHVFAYLNKMMFDVNLYTKEKMISNVDITIRSILILVIFHHVIVAKDLFRWVIVFYSIE